MLRGSLAVVAALFAGVQGAAGQSPRLVGGPVVRDGGQGQKGGALVGGGSRSSACNYGVDDGSTEISIGLGASGTLTWLNALETQPGCEQISEIWIVWGAPGAVPLPTNGSPATIYLWDDPTNDGDPTDAVLLVEQAVTVENAGSGAEARYTIPVTSVSGTFFVGASITSPAFVRGAAIDNSVPVVSPPVSWICGSYFTAFDPENLGANEIPPLLLSDEGYPGEFVMRAVGGSVGYVYQGLLEDAGQPVNGVVDLSFFLFLDATTDTLVEIVPIPGVIVEDGLFSVSIPFSPSNFDGTDRWLGISVANPAGSVAVQLEGRQRIAAAPMASVANAYYGDLGWSQLTGVPAGFADGIDNIGTVDGHSLDAADGSPTDVVFVDNNGRVAINLTAPPTPQGRLHVRGGSGEHPAVIERTGGSGTLVQFRVDGASVGEISVSGGGFVTYGSFTGVHLVDAAERPSHAALVRLSGRNSRISEDPSSEIIYGVELTTMANDPAVIGCFLAGDQTSDTGRDSVMSVGNGEMWVVQTTRGIMPGDLLIASDVAGCAMLDDPARFARGNVVARAAEPVDWSRIAPEPDGTRRALVSVLFDRFERGPETASLQERIDTLDAENRSLRARLEAIEAMLHNPARKAGGQ